MGGSDNLLNSVSRYATERCAMRPDGVYLVALSGGADSVALLLILRELNYTVEAVHCNFLLRGDESYRDENFCKTLCDKLSVKLHLVHFDTRPYASLHRVSIEMAARELRYGYFEKLRTDIGASDICVAHHSDDNVETVLLNLVRGTGISGLTGMSARNGHVLRPLLCVSRNDLLQFLKSRGQDYVTDSTNLEAIYTRNAIRLNLLPAMEGINPSVREAISLTAQNLTEAAKMLDGAVQTALSRCFDGESVDLGLLFAEASPEYVLFSLLRRYGFTSPQIADIVAWLMRYNASGVPSGRCWRSATHELTTHKGRLLLSKADDDAPQTLKIPEEGVYRLNDGTVVRVSRCVKDDNFCIEKSQTKAYFDAQKVVFPLVLRRWENGDRLVPFGMKGSKLVSNLLTDLKMPLPAKRRQRVMTDARGHLMWVVGVRTDNRCRISDSTNEVVVVSIE